MNKEKSICDKIIEFDKYLSSISIPLPEEFKLLNPFNESSKLKTEQVVQKFYNKFYNDNKIRRMILGSSPARRGTATTGIPFEDAIHLQN